MAVSPSALRAHLDEGGAPLSNPKHSAHVCFVGLGNLPVLAPEYSHHPIGGEQVQQTLLARAFAKLGYRVTMVTLDYGQPEGATWDHVRTHKAYAAKAGLPGIRFIHPRWTGLWGALARADADVYYTSCAGAMIGQVAMFCRRYARRQIFRVASDADCEAALPLIKYWRDKKLYQYGLRTADCVLVQSEQQREMLQATFDVQSSLAGMLVERGAHDRSFSARDYPVLWVNNLRSLKRPELFFEAAQTLPHLAFHVVGGAAPGYESYADAFRARVQSQANFTYHGQVPYQAVNAFYERARVCVNTSEIEGFPNSYLQAWSRGTPVVTFLDPDGLIAKHGLGAAVRSTEEMSQAIDLLASSESEWRAASERCRRFVAREFNEERVLAPYREALNRLAGIR